MSKQRQSARAERLARTQARSVADRAARDRAAAERARRENRSLTWRRLRLWQHGPAFRRNRERWGALASLVLMILLVVWVATREFEHVLVAALVLLVSAPVLVALFFDRSRK